MNNECEEAGCYGENVINYKIHNKVEYVNKNVKA